MPPPDVKTGVVLLAAGQGKRFGGDKLVADFRGQPLWTWAADTAENFDFGERILVIGPNSLIIGRPGWRLVENSSAERGMGTSLSAGVRALSDSDRVIVMLADMPLVSRTHLGRILAAQGAAFTQYCGGKAGCPAIFPRSVFSLLESLKGDRGARSLALKDAKLIPPPHERELADVDEVCDLRRLKFLD